MKDVTKVFVTLFFVLFFLVYKIHINMETQQRQIDEICQVTFALARLQGAEDQNGFEGGKEYCLFFADYNSGMVLLGEFDYGFSCREKPRLVIMGPIDARTLDDWAKQPLIYGRYRKI